VVGEDHGAFDQVLQLANVPRPVVRRQRRHGLRANAIDALAELPGESLDEVGDKGLYVLAALA
jgi:hypothetical protein